MASTSTSGRGEWAPDPFRVLEPPNKKMKSSLSVKQFDVFINHRGPDVKTTLAWQLYNSLKNAGISAYLDSEETELGDCFPSAIKNAIFSARVHIAILSPRYAESAWCLAELALMFQTKARIIPLFYHVQPSDFRYIINGVADAFSKHEEKDRYPNHDVQQWKDCLQNVSGIKGYELNGQNDDLNKLCCDVVRMVLQEKKKRKIPLQVAKYEVALDELVKDFQSHCQSNGEMKDKIIGMFGMGGSGKTTLAKYLFNRKSSEFSGSTFLFDVRGRHVKDELTSLQSQLLKDLIHLKEKSIGNINDGITSIKDNLQRTRESRFLIVIDDADHQKQLDALVPIHALNPKSLVIVTTRDERLLIQAGVNVRYKMKEMNPEHSRELFCWHAFQKQSCKSGFQNLVESFVKVCGGLPLALQVMGGHVSGSDKSYWKLELDVAEKTLHKDIKDTLKISYDALEEDEKQIFMDIACFFIGKEASMAISIWKASGWRAEHALQTLKDKCLVDLQYCFDRYGDPEFDLRMHDHLRDLGRDMADNEMSNSRRLWRPTNLIEMENIVKEEGKNFRYFNETATYMTYFLEISKTSTDLQWLEFRFDCGYEYIPEWIPLQNLHTLRLRGVSSARLWQTGDRVPLKSKELDWSFDDCDITDFNELVSSFGMLKHLESLYLQSKFEIQSLEWNCFLKSVRELTNLKTLKLELQKVEGEFTLSNRGETTDDQFLMRSLEAITLRYAWRTRKVSISGRSCPTLKSLKLYFMKDLIEMDLTGITTLECLVLVSCWKLRKVSVNNLLNLEMFRIRYCPAMTELPNFGRLSCLKRIYISRCENVEDISAIEELKGLKRIWIANCPELKNIKAIEQLKGMKRIWIEGCEQLEGVICFKELKELKRIFIGHCARLQNIEGIEFLVRLESIIIAACQKLQNIKGIEELKGLKDMIISDTSTISCVERLQTLPLELTILVGRPAMPEKDQDEEPFFNKDKIGNTLSMADGFCETEDERWYKEIEEMIHSFHKESQNSLSTFIFCAMLDERPYIGSDSMLEGWPSLKDIDLCGDGKEWIYTCVVNEERLSKYDSWMPSSNCDIKKAFLMGVKKGEERKTLRILQSLFAQLRLGEYQETTDKFHDGYDGEYDEEYDSDYDEDEEYEYVDEVEEYDSDDDDHNEDVS